MSTNRPDMQACIIRALEAAANDWLAGVSEADRREGGRLDTMFRVSGWSPAYGVPKGPRDKVRDWCGMAVCAWLLEGGLNPGLNTSFLHEMNVQDFFTYGKPTTFNGARLDRFVVVDGKERRIEDWHRSEKASRRWLTRAAVTDGLLDQKTPNPDLFQPGDVACIDWSGLNRADHIVLVSQWDAEDRILHTWEGNRSGKNVAGDDVADAVVPLTYDLKTSYWRRRMFGVGRFSRLDFGSEVVR